VLVIVPTLYVPPLHSGDIGLFNLVSLQYILE